MAQPLHKTATVLAEELRHATGPELSIEDTLTTNERVIARVTDGIYRRPGSAIRELIANAYDADATSVSVKTDRPHFSRISVEDNGVGMTPEAVVHLLRNIGGSAKRTSHGQELGIASPQDSTLSPGGRKLIGKLGIGIFSVSQLTHSFQIITKTRGDDYRTVVLVNLTQFADESVTGDETEFKAGRYRFWRERTDDPSSHGTTVVLTAIRPQTQATLRSEQMWSAIDNPISEESEAKSLSVIPAYHIGRLDAQGNFVEDSRHSKQSLPWDDPQEPSEAFKSMVDVVWAAVGGRASVKLSDIFDTYLQMIWQLSLALPLPYVERNVLDEPVEDDWAYFYKLSNRLRGSAEQVQSNDEAVTVRELTGLPSVSAGEEPGSDFTVYFDGIRLLRPLKYRNLPTTSHVLKKPMVFVGAMREDFQGFERDVSAGPLEFEGYMFWTPKVAPTEHQGVLVRVHGASGTLFDTTFFNYQVAELTRLRQITCEIFVKQGLEAALNIDRESFNTAHPHTVLLTRWVHSALRQLATAQKGLSSRLRADVRDDLRQLSHDRMRMIVEAANELRSDGEGVVPDVAFSSGNDEKRASNSGAATVVREYDLQQIVDEIPARTPTVPRPENMRKLEAITQLLSLYDLLDQLSPKEQNNLLGSILGILEAENLG